MPFDTVMFPEFRPAEQREILAHGGFGVRMRQSVSLRMDFSVVFVPLLGGVEGLATKSALEFLLWQDRVACVLSDF